MPPFYQLHLMKHQGNYYLHFMAQHLNPFQLIINYLQSMSKQNQHLFRPFPSENPETKPHDELTLNSNCQCAPCKTKSQKIPQQITWDNDLQLLKSKQKKSKNSDFILFLNQIFRYSSTALPHLAILDTIVFNNDGSVKFIVNFQGGKLKIAKLTTSLKNYMSQIKYNHDLQFQKKKYQREHLGFSFTQLDHQSEKHIKQFENNIKFMNPLLNRVAITKLRQKQQQQILTQNQMNSMFVKISRKLFDFTKMQYMQVFPVMYGHEQLSYVKKVKYFRQREINKKNFKVAEHYIGNWYNKNQTLQALQLQFLNSIKNNEDETLMYYTYKLFIFFQRIANKMVECALVEYITNDQGVTFFLKNIQCLNLFALHEVQQRVHQLPKKLENYEEKSKINLQKQMKNNFDLFQRNYERLKNQHNEIEQKRLKDAYFSNKVYESLGYNLPQKYKSQSFSKWMGKSHQAEETIQLFATNQNTTQFKSN